MISGDALASKELPGIFEEYYGKGDCRRFLVVCRSRSRRRHDEFLPPQSACEWYFNIKTVDDINSPERADLGIVLNQIEHMRRTEAMHLLSRLRDQHCRKVIACINSDIFSEQELLALGYMKQERPSSDGRYFLFDPELFFERREWNTPESWAHPENFNKKRW